MKEIKKMTIQFKKKKKKTSRLGLFFLSRLVSTGTISLGDRPVMEDVGVLLFFRVCGGWMKNKEKER